MWIDGACSTVPSAPECERSVAVEAVFSDSEACGARGTFISRVNQLPDMADDLEILSCMDDEDGGNRPFGRDRTVSLAVVVSGAVQPHVEKVEAVTNIGSQPRRSFACAPREHQSVQPAQGRAHGGHAGLDPVDVDVVGEPGVGIPRIHGNDHLAEVTGVPPEPLQSRVSLQGFLNFVGR